MTKAEIKMNEVLKEPCVSFWLKKAIKELKQRDPIDAFRDLEFLKELWSEHCNELADNALHNR